jgi:hypothetical protein
VEHQQHQEESYVDGKLDEINNEIEPQYPLALGCPAWHLNVHLVNVIRVRELLVRRFLSTGGCLLALSQCVFALLSDLLPALRQALARLSLDNLLLSQREHISYCGPAGTCGQYGELEEKHDHHIGTGLLNHCAGGVSEQPDIVEQACDEWDGKASVEEARVRRGLLFENLDSPIANPAPNLASDESRKHDEEPGADLLSKYGHSQTCLGDGEPGTLGKLFDFDGTEGSKAESRKAVEEGAIEQEGEVYQG